MGQEGRTMTDSDAMLEDCNKRYSKLNDWERGFIDSLLDMPEIRSLSPAQYETLEKIWDRIT